MMILNIEERICVNFLSKINGTIPMFGIKPLQDMRSSSPKIDQVNFFYLTSNFSFNEFIDNLLNKSYIYISNSTFTNSVNKSIKKLACSKTKSVELGKRNNHCEPTKYLSQSTIIYEHQCIKTSNALLVVSVKCPGKFNSSFIPYLDGIRQDPMELLTKDKISYLSCCKGKNYVLQFYGNCNIKNLNNIIEHTHFEKGKCDNIRNILVNTGYYVNRACLYKVSFDSECNNKDIKLPTCRRVQCDKLTH